MKFLLPVLVALSLGGFTLPSAAQVSSTLTDCPAGVCPGSRPFNIGLYQAPWKTKLAAATEAARRSDWSEAARSARIGLDEVTKAMAESPRAAQLYALDQLALLRVLGKVLLNQGSPDKALDYLETALSIETGEIDQREASGNPRLASMSSSEALAAFSATLSINLSAARFLNRPLITPEMEGGPIEKLLSDRLPEIDLTAVFLVEAYARLGRRNEAYKVFDGPFQRYLARQASNPYPQSRINLNVAVETACLRMGIALAGLGRSHQADRAFDCALQTSTQNFAQLGISNTVGLIMESFAERRRLLLGAYAAYVMPSEDRKAHRNLVQLVAETKGISSRYRERRRAIWTHSDDPEFFRSRQAFAEHDRSLIEMDTGAEAAMVMAVWMTQESLLMNEHLEDFRRAGLHKVFAPGHEILERTQVALRRDNTEDATDSALIGYAVYRPVDFRSGELSASRVLRYAITHHDIEVRDIGAVSTLNQQVRRWRREAMTGSALSASNADHMHLNRELSARLLGELSPEAERAKHWVIDPDGILSLLPFEALTRPGKDDQLVIDNHTVRYVTSIADFADPTDLANNRVPSNRAVIVGDPLFANAPAEMRRTVANELRSTSGQALRALTLKPLPDTREESLRVAGSLRKLGIDSEVHLGRQATRDAFEFKAAPRFLHVATHGLFLDSGVELSGGGYVRVASALPGMQSALALSARDESIEGNSFLTGSDITRLNLLGTELVVFSACDTGNGEVTAGEGVVSLRRSVEEAGARSSITALWPVPSASTTTLMVDFYERVVAGMSKSEALRQAKLELMKSQPSPLHWAGFLLAGEL